VSEFREEVLVTRTGEEGEAELSVRQGICRVSAAFRITPSVSRAPWREFLACAAPFSTAFLSAIAQGKAVL